MPTLDLPSPTYLFQANYSFAGVSFFAVQVALQVCSYKNNFYIFVYWVEACCLSVVGIQPVKLTRGPESPEYTSCQMILFIFRTAVTKLVATDKGS